MTKNKAVKSIAKGVALGILWPAAFSYLAGKKIGKFVGETAHESLDLARTWADSAEEGVTEAYHSVDAWTDAIGTKKSEVTT